MRRCEQRALLEIPIQLERLLQQQTSFCAIRLRSIPEHCRDAKTKERVFCAMRGSFIAFCRKLFHESHSCSKGIERGFQIAHRTEHVTDAAKGCVKLTLGLLMRRLVSEHLTDGEACSIRSERFRFFPHRAQHLADALVATRERATFVVVIGLHPHELLAYSFCVFKRDERRRPIACREQRIAETISRDC